MTSGHAIPTGPGLVGVGLLLLALAAVVWRISERPLARVELSARTADAVALWSVTSSAAPAAPRAPARRMLVQAAASGESAAIEVCGFGRRALADGSAAAQQNLETVWPELDGAVAAASLQITERLRADADERRRAVGLWLSDGLEMLADDRAQSAAAAACLARSGCASQAKAVQAATEAACTGRRTCTSEAQAAGAATASACAAASGCANAAPPSGAQGPRPRETRDLLAAMAARTHDPQVYALAWSACTTTLGPRASMGAACAALRTAQWSRLDPDNGLPWLVALEQAAERGQAAEFDDALYRLGQARRIEQGFGRAAATLLSLPLPELPEGLQALAALDAIGIEQVALPGWPALQQACGGARLADPNRRTLCQAVAERLVHDADTQGLLGLGLALGRELGWPAERLADLEAERKDAADALTAQLPSGHPTTCDGVAALRSHFQRVATLGEVGAARQALRERNAQAR
ncbi:hypothetical protein [Caldimonas sp. KR1-144]|uniref:hypothetical protein n=1 Tax=Caldimonas sp. KR1-144 TaxID=3400911 RepID=UPI003C1042DA